MRYLLLVLLLFGACAAKPTKIAWFKLDKGQWDVVWMLSPEGKLLRCTGRDEKPECKQAEAVAECQSAPLPAPPVAPASSPAPTPPIERKSFPAGTGLLE